MRAAPIVVHRQTRPAAVCRPTPAGSCVAPAWRRMLVTASRSTSDSTDSCAGARRTASRLRLQPDAGRIERAAGARDFRGDALGAIARIGLAHLAQGLARDLLHLADLLRARSASLPMSLPASSDLSTTTERVWPRTSCRSRAMRSRSATLARCSICSCARQQALVGAPCAAHRRDCRRRSRRRAGPGVPRSRDSDAAAGPPPLKRALRR